MLSLVMSSSSGPQSNYRRTWDKEDFAERAQKRVREEEEEGKERDRKHRGHHHRRGEDDAKKPTELLKAREGKIDLESRLGKSVVVTKATPSSNAGGYYCSLCDCLIKDSINYLDHINGRRHQKNMGRTMKVENSTVEQVKARFAKKKEELEKKATEGEYDLEDRVRAAADEEQRIKELKKEKKREKQQEGVDDAAGDGEESDFAAMMGFSSFGGSKKNG